MKNPLQIIGLGGTNGSGKDTVGEILAKNYNYWFFSLTNLLRDECRRRDLPVVRENLRQISAEWRREFGLAILVDRTMDEFTKSGGFQKYAGVVMSSLRNSYESRRIHELGGTVIWVDADPQIRYQRIQDNAAARGRSGEDNISLEEFIKHEEEEMHRPADGDEANLNSAAVKEQSNIYITNSSDLETLKATLSKIIQS